MQKSFSKWTHFLHSFDIFAVPFTPSLSLKQKQIHHSSQIGGFISLIVCFLSCYYGVSTMVSWINNEMVLKVQTSQVNYNNSIYHESFSKKNNLTHFEFKVYSNDEYGPDPFQKNELFLIPILIDPINYIVKNLLEFHDEAKGQLIIDWQNNLLDGNILVIFVQCIGNERYLKKNQTCGSQEKADYFFNQEGLELYLVVHQEIIDLVTESVSTQEAYTTTFLQKEFSSEKVVTLQYSFFDISQAILFDSSHTQILTTSFTARDQMSTRNVLTGKYHYFLPKVNDVYASFSIGSGQVVNHTIVRAQSLSEVLAQIGSILQTLLLIRYFVQYLNSRLMYKKFKNFFLSIFFPEIVQIIKQGRGKKRKYNLNSKEIEKKSYEDFRKRVDELIEEKLNYANLIYEVAKMQAVLEDISTNFNIYNSHLKSLSIPLEQINFPNVYRVANTWDLKNNNINCMLYSKLYPFAFNYSLSTQCQNFCQSLEMDNIDSNLQKTQTKSQLIMKLDINKK